jgi:hypothetical protein
MAAVSIFNEMPDPGMDGFKSGCLEGANTCAMINANDQTQKEGNYSASSSHKQ